MITHVKFVSVPVTDYDRALKFYTEKLGFAVVADQRFNDASRWIELDPGTAVTRIVLFTPPGHEQRIGTVMNVSLACDDLKKTYEELSSRGVVFTVLPTNAPWGVYAQCTDSEGNLLNLSSP